MLSEQDIHKSICVLLHETFISKRKDYGKSTERTFKEFGSISMLIRIIDKIERLRTLVANNTEPNNESINDSILDAANYLIIWLMEITKCTMGVNDGTEK